MFARIAKLAAVSIFSTAVFGALWPDCKPLAKVVGSQTFWKHFTGELGDIPFPAKFSVCTGRNYFFEVKGGAKMLSVLDRQKGRILRRDNKLQPLMHELAHLYLDLRWKVLPYSVSEPLVLTMVETEKCETRPEKYAAPEIIQNAWKDRANLSRCELMNLLRSVLMAESSVREALPLR